MPIAAPLIIGGLSAAGGIGSAMIGSSAAKSAAQTQANAANQAAQLQYDLGLKNLDFQKYIFDLQQQNMLPWLNTGKEALSKLWDFTQNIKPFEAPNASDLASQPGYQFGLDQGTQAIQRSAAARGGLFSGGTGKALTRYAQDYAGTKYNDYFNRAMDIYNTNTIGPYNRFANIAGVGQTAANTLNSAASTLGSNTGNIYMNMANTIGNYMQNAGAARASGYIGSANAWGNAFSSIPNNLLSLYFMRNLFGGGGGGNYGAFTGGDPIAG